MEKIANKQCGTVIILLLFSVVFVFFNSKNSPLYFFNEWGDVNIYFSIGKGMMNGLTPYKDLFDHKGPFIFFIYGIAYLISNDSFLGVYLLQCVALFVNMFFAYKIARLYLNDFLGYVVALCYALLLFNKNYYGGSAEEFISVFIIVSSYYFILFFRNKDQNSKDDKKQMFIHGMMLSLVFLSKLSVCIFWIPIFGAIFLQLFANKEYKRILSCIIYLVFGFLMPLLPFILYFIHNDALADSYWGYIEFNSLYAEFKPGFSIIRKAAAHFFKLSVTDYISFPITLLGLFLLSFTRKYIQNYLYRIGVLLSFIFSFVVICLSKYIMTYAHIVIYVYAIFGLIFLFGLVEKYVSGKYRVQLTVLTFAIALLIGIENKNFFGQDNLCLFRKKECNYMQKQFAEIINKEQNPTLLNIGLDLGVFTKANIVPSYKYFFYPNIPYHIYPEIRDYQMDLIRKKEPMFVVIGDKSAFYSEYSRLPELKENYDLVSVYHQNMAEYDNEVFLYRKKN